MWGPPDYNFRTAQMSAKRGLRQFGQEGADTLMKELQQLINRRVMRPRDANTLSQGEKKSALKYLMFLKEKRCGKVNGRDGPMGESNDCTSQRRRRAPYHSIGVIVPVNHDRWKKESEGDDV